MEILFKIDTLKAIKKAGAKSIVFTEKDDWPRDKEIESDHILTEDYEIIKTVLKSPLLATVIENKRAFKKIDALASLHDSGGKGVEPKNLEIFPEAIRKRMMDLGRKWAFMSDDQYETMVPFFVEKAVFFPAEKKRDYYVPAHVNVELEAIERGNKKSKSIKFVKEDLGGTVDEVLGKKDLFIETPKLVSDYEAEMALYVKYAPLTGEQFLAKGIGVQVEEGSRWRREHIQFEKDGASSKVIMDDTLQQGKEEGTISTRFWSGKKGRDEEDDDGNVFPVPTHPVIRCFHLGIHEYVETYIGSIEPYKYDTSLQHKLVLPKEHKELVDALTGSAIKKMSDIISGKAIGVIILSSGKPGTGKTLTAEVYSEVAQRPLYMVQCSQLGTNEEELEKHLGTVLQRATRWRAILLIDEADVYIHERGDDIQQNAIVGVFLRLLEYYNGIMFLTTNRETIIDDAIISRVTAHVRYDVPEGEDRDRIWKIMLTQYGVKELLDDTSIGKLVKEFPNISGRSIRTLIRLSKIMADRDERKVKFDDLKWAAKFHDFTEIDKEK